MTILNSKKTVAVAIAAIILSCFLIFLSNHTQHKFISLLLLVVCVFLSALIFVPLFSIRAFHSGIGKLIPGMAIVVYGLFLLELFSRILIPYKSQFDQGLLSDARKPYPYIQFKGDSLFNRVIGYPEKWKMEKKEPSEYSIFVLGGSTVTGGNPPISEILQSKFLQAGYSNVRVYNTGVISSNTKMELARVVYEIADYSPDLIVSYSGGNDILMPYNYDPRPGYPFNFCSYENNLFSEINKYPALALLAYKSNLLRVLFRDYFTNLFGKQDELRKQVSYGTEIWENEIANEYVSALVKTEKIAKAFGAEFVAILQPVLYYKNKCSAKELELRMHEDEYQFSLRLREKILHKTASSNLSHFFNLTEIYANDTADYFIDPIHTRQPGIQLVANRMFTEILNGVQIPKPNSASN